MKAAMGILTTDTSQNFQWKNANIGTPVKIYGLAKGSGMIYPNMATTLRFCFYRCQNKWKYFKAIIKKKYTKYF